MSQFCGWVSLWVFITTSLVAAEPAWQSVMPAIEPADAVQGEWSKSGSELRIRAASGGRIMLPVSPTGEYDFRVSFTRTSGQHSIGLLFVHGGKMCAFEADAWGQHLAGFQDIGGRDMRQNSTAKNGVTLENGRRYMMTVEVRKDRIRGLLDDKELASFTTDGSDLSLSDLWRMPRATHLGLAAWDADTTFHTVEVRSLTGRPLEIAPAKSPSVASTTPGPTPASSPAARRNGKKVLIVIANQDFFYREYADPREELERAGYEVVVGAGRVAPCRPHGNSGEGSDGGVVTPDIALVDVKAADYDAILFSGGWGASMYQYAFNGRYNNDVYNGDRRTKAEVNRVINEFIAADKYVCALCNAVSVLAWARVNGKSPLQGKRVCAPVREAASGLYNGRQAQPSCRWHPEANGAILSPPGAIGVPNTNRDDVLVDGKIITGEDDPSAREMGRRIAQVLATPPSAAANRSIRESANRPSVSQ